jgi:hypothetical protein
VYEPQKSVLATAGVQRPIEVDCGIDDIPHRSGTYGGTVTYDGTEVPFKVRFHVVEDDYGRSQQGAGESSGTPRCATRPPRESPTSACSCDGARPRSYEGLRRFPPCGTS